MGYNDELVFRQIDSELWREYDWVSPEGVPRVYRIECPMKLVTRAGGTTHRVVDAMGVVHCVPAPGRMGCVLRWASRDGLPEVKF